MSVPANVEYAGGHTLEQTSASRRGILSRAPAWWRQVAERGGATLPAPRGPALQAKKPAPAASSSTRRAPVIGWVAGCCCPGVSRPAYAAHDGERLPEQFTPRAMQGILDQVRSITTPVPLTWGHGGEVITATDSLDLLFRMDRTVGLLFDVRLRDTRMGRMVLDEIDGRSLGVSIGFAKTKSWTVDREGVGRMRVVDQCVLDHVAILPRSETVKPAYSGARCYGARDRGIACVRDLHDRARAWAFRYIAAQAGVRSPGR